jgi:predicted transposase/invertase (TIGR01784 family)
MNSKYISPFTDFGFKKIFGEEASKPHLIDFLNTLLPEKDKIYSLEFKNTEFFNSYDKRKAVFDIYCENEKGEKFIVELQKASQTFFKDRTIFYSTFPIREQAEKGNWNYELKAVYCIGILDFRFDDYESEPEKSEVLHTVKLKNQNGKVFYDKLTYIYLEIPNFKKTESELENRLDKWLYFIKNLEDLQSIPTIFNEEVFESAFEKAQFSNLNYDETVAYEMGLKIIRDNKNTMDYAYDEGKNKGKIEGKIEGIKEGIKEGRIEIAKNLLKKGMSISEIIKITGIDENEVNNIIK